MNSEFDGSSLTFGVDFFGEFHSFRGREVDIRRSDSENDGIWIGNVMHDQISNLMFDVHWLIVDRNLTIREARLEDIDPRGQTLVRPGRSISVSVTTLGE